MTLPIDRILPTPPELATVEDAKRYLKTLTFELQDMYDGMVQNINGFIRNNADVDGSAWMPEIASTGTSGTISYAGNGQIGWSIRQGIFTQIWCDVQWTAIGASTGNLYVNLPYKVTKSLKMPFVGVVQYSGITLGGAYTNLVINGIPSTYRGEIWRTGTALTTDNLSIPSSGRLIAYLTYIGVEDE